MQMHSPENFDEKKEQWPERVSEMTYFVLINPYICSL